MLGQMLFRAVELVPSESVHIRFILNALPQGRTSGISMANIDSWIKSWYFGNSPKTDVLRRPLLLWGLTLGITADFLGLLSPQGVSAF